LPFQSSGPHALSSPLLCLFVVCGESSSKIHHSPSPLPLLIKPNECGVGKRYMYGAMATCLSRAASSLFVVRALWLCAAGPPAFPMLRCSTFIAGCFSFRIPTSFPSRFFVFFGLRTAKAPHCFCFSVDNTFLKSWHHALFFGLRMVPDLRCELQPHQGALCCIVSVGLLLFLRVSSFRFC
jgi:hypothetical protein